LNFFRAESKFDSLVPPPNLFCNKFEIFGYPAPLLCGASVVRWVPNIPELTSLLEFLAHKLERNPGSLEFNFGSLNFFSWFGTSFSFCLAGVSAKEEGPFSGTFFLTLDLSLKS